MNNRIRSIIQSFLTPKDDYTHLKPIGIVTGGYGTQWGVGFKPMDGYKKEAYDIKDDLTDDSKRIEILDKLNKDIRAYNKWSDGRLEYPNLDEYSPWSFLVVRADLEYVDKKLYVEIIDEELYKLKDDDPDFVPRFNKSIYDYIKLQKQSAEEDGRWDEKNIWYQPFRSFGDWFDKNPSDAEPYQLGFYKTDITDALYTIADDLTIDVCDKGTKKFRELVEACEWWCERHTHKGKNKTAHQLTRAFYKAHSEGKL